MTYQQIKPLGRTVTVLGVLAALTLTACSDGEVAEFEDAGQTEQDVASQSADDVSATSEDAAQETGTEPLVAEAGLIHEDISQAPPVLETIRPENGSVITPAGTLTVESVEKVETVPSAEIGLQGESGDEVARAADGEEFRILSMSFTPVPATQAFGDEKLEVDAALALNVGGVQQHLHDLTDQRDYRILVSVPQGGGSSLTVSSEGHDQSVDVLTGERVDDDVAAGYYREVTKQDLNHTFPTAKGTVGFRQDHGDEKEYEARVDYDLRINSVSLAAWSAEDGWASPGEAWMIIEWAYELSGDTGIAGVGSELSDTEITLSAAVQGEQLEDRVARPEDKRRIEGEQVTVLPVPIETVEVGIEFAGGTEFDLTGGTSHVLIDESAAHLEFASDILTVTFPDTRFGSDAGDVEDAEDDQATETGEPGVDEEDETARPDADDDGGDA